MDTGATPNVLDWHTYQDIDVNVRPALHAASSNLRAADGTPLKVYGDTEIEIYFNGQVFCVDVVVAELKDIQGIIGMSFLSKEACIIDAFHGLLTIGDTRISLQRQDGPECCRIQLYDDVTIEPNSEHVVVGKFQEVQWKSDIGVIEPLSSFVEHSGLMVSNAVVNTCKENPLLTCVNLSDDPVTIKKGTTIATISEAQNVTHISVSQNASGDISHIDPKNVDDLPEHLKDIAGRSIIGLDQEKSQYICGLIHKNQDLFLSPNGRLGRTKLVKHTISTGDARPFKSRPYKPAIKQRHVIEEHIQDMLDGDQIVPSDSPWASPVVLVTKKDGSTRFCVDYRGLNKVTVKDSYPIPNIQDCIDTLAGAKWFHTLDLASGYWQCEVAEEDQPKTAFVTHKGLFQFKVLPFGLTNAPATFERLMERVLNGLQWERCLVYLDDIIVYGKSFDEASNNLQLVFDRIREAGLTLKPKKCNLFQEKVSFLGHIVTADGVHCEPEKIEAVKNWEVPKTVTGVRSFLGFANYYRRFVKSFAHIASPLTNLTKKDQPFKWTKECQNAFDTLKTRLTEAPILAYPSMDPDAKYILDTDASNFGIGAVLSQVQDGVERVIAYASQTLSRSQRNYCTTYRELLAVVTFVKYFRHYLLGVDSFTIRTDHSSLRWLTNFKDPEGLIGRWLLSIQPYNFTIEHRRGTSHGNADGLSRKEVVMRRRRCLREECTECETPVGQNVCVLTTGQSTRHSSQTDENSNIDNNENPRNINGTDNSSLILGDPNFQCSELESQSIETDQVNPNWMENWDKTDLRAKQLSDTSIKRVIDWKEEGRECPSRADLLSESEDVRNLCGQWKWLELIDGILYRRWTSRCTSIVKFQYITPKSLRETILHHLHNTMTAGHFGVKRTLMKIRQKFYWPRCKRDVELWCQECSVCAQIKPGPGFRARLHQIPVRNKLDRIALDILGELPETENGNKNILVISDYYTKWTHAVAIPDQTALTVADKLMTEFIAIFGVPIQIHTDQGRNFESHLFKQVCEILKINKTRTTPFHAQSDGQVERWNRTIQQMLKAFVNENRDDWDDLLPYLCMAYRATTHESTGCSPNLMMFGHEINMPLDIIVGTPEKGKPNIECPVEYVQWLENSFHDIFQYADEQLKRSAKRQKHFYDMKSKPTKYQVGSYVWRWYPPAARGKLSKGWTGPFKILECPSSIHCVIQYLPNSPRLRVHIDTLKPYYGKTPQNWQISDESCEEANENLPSSDEDEQTNMTEGPLPNLDDNREENE